MSQESQTSPRPSASDDLMMNSPVLMSTHIYEQGGRFRVMPIQTRPLSHRQEHDDKYAEPPHRVLPQQEQVQEGVLLSSSSDNRTSHRPMGQCLGSFRWSRCGRARTCLPLAATARRESGKIHLPALSTKLPVHEKSRRHRASRGPFRLPRYSPRDRVGFKPIAELGRATGILPSWC